MSEEKPDLGQTNRAVTTLPAVPPRLKRQFSLVPTSFTEAKELATMIARSEFAPKDYKEKPESVLIAVQMGADLGLSPMQSLQNLAVINGRPSIWGDAALALVMPALQDFKESYEGTIGTDDYTAVCSGWRKGWSSPTVRKFSILDAKTAKLWGKTGRDGQATPWVTYPYRMLQLRARGFCLRDCGADLLMGLVLAEEAGDYPEAITVTEFTSEPVGSLLDKLDDELREKIQKGFDTCGFTAGQRTVKTNEYLAGEKSPSELASAGVKLYEWLKDEFSRQKTGKSRDPKGDNSKPGGASTAASDGPNGARSPGTAQGPPSGGDSADQGRPASGGPASGPLTAQDIPFAGRKPIPDGELF